MFTRWNTIAFVILSVGCAASPPQCRLLDSRAEWTRLDSPPSFVKGSTYQDMVAKGAPPHPDEVVWYRETSGRYAACVMGNRSGCGESISYFSGDQMEEIGEIVVCADRESPSQE